MIGDEFPQVLADAQAGRESAFVELYRDLHPGLLRYLRVAARGVAEDVASETWLEIVKRLSRFKGDEPGFRAWAFTIARSKSVDSSRRAARAPSLAFEADEADFATPPDDTEERVDERMSTRRALALIATLPADQAEAVTLRIVAGLDVPQVAAVMNRSPGAVRVLSHRGLKRLAANLSATIDEGV